MSGLLMYFTFSAKRVLIYNCCEDEAEQKWNLHISKFFFFFNLGRQRYVKSTLIGSIAKGCLQARSLLSNTFFLTSESIGSSIV